MEACVPATTRNQHPNLNLSVLNTKNWRAIVKQKIIQLSMTSEINETNIKTENIIKFLMKPMRSLTNTCELNSLASKHLDSTNSLKNATWTQPCSNHSFPILLVSYPWIEYSYMLLFGVAYSVFYCIVIRLWTQHFTGFRLCTCISQILLLRCLIASYLFSLLLQFLLSFL